VKNPKHPAMARVKEAFKAEAGAGSVKPPETFGNTTTIKVPIQGQIILFTNSPFPPVSVV
jgi:hypothetical protein